MANSQQWWAPFTPSTAEPWDLKKVAHLRRRAGFGATWAELQRDLKDGPAAAVERLLKPRPHTPDERQVLDGLRQGVLDSNDFDHGIEINDDNPLRAGCRFASTEPIEG